jgi:imidazolonepropionase-like amidohydrolase
MRVLTIRHLAELATPEGTAARTGEAQGRIRRVRDAALRIEDGRIVHTGPDAEIVSRWGETPAPDEVVLDGRGRTALHGFVDRLNYIQLE